MDVVPTKGQNWESNPFILTKRDGKLYARGSEDDKGPLVASYIAFKKIIKDLKLPVSKRARLIFLVVMWNLAHVVLLIILKKKLSLKLVFHLMLNFL
ncbi:MAG: M20/M25/M40 family metallo-hydrolase [Clostridium sp.]|nr:MAG: M20/M25/M40 family metallo-hydrolase [Clostridium sp.]